MKWFVVYSTIAVTCFGFMVPTHIQAANQNGTASGSNKTTSNNTTGSTSNNSTSSNTNSTTGSSSSGNTSSGSAGGNSTTGRGTGSNNASTNGITQDTRQTGYLPDKDGQCHLVLVTVPPVNGNCNDIDFYTYLKALLDQLVPYIMLIAMIMVVFSGLQYMLSGVSGDSKAAKARILGVLGGVIFFFLIRLILNQIEPGIGLQQTTTSSSGSTSGGTGTTSNSTGGSTSGSTSGSTTTNQSAGASN